MEAWPGAPKSFVGTSPWIGAGQFGARAFTYRAQLHDRPEAMLAILRRAAELGWGVQPFCLPALVSVLATLRHEGGDVPILMVCGMDDFDAELDACRQLQPRAICIHAAVADRVTETALSRRFERIEATGALPGVATHQPARTIPLVQEMACQLIMAPVNPAGIFMGSDPDEAREAIRQSRIPIVAKKTLAAGRIDPREGIAHAQSLGVAAIAIGVASVAELEQDHAIIQGE